MGKAAKAVVGYVLMFVGVWVSASGYPQLGLKIAQFGQLLIVSNALDIVSQALVKKPRARRSGQDIEYFGTVEPRRIIYGTNKVSGMNVIPPATSGVENKYLHQILVLAGHDVSAITDVYFDQTTIASANIAAVAGATGDGLVNSGTYANKAWVRRYTGAPTGSPETWTADWKLVNEGPAACWTSAHRGKRIAYLALTFQYDENVYKTGKPEVSCLVQGAKCYDPRLDVTPGASPTNPSYIAFTSNPALCLAHYLTSATVGLGEATTRIDWDAVVTAANICDENVAIPPVSPSTTQDRYTCNVVLEVAADEAGRRENIETLAQAMMGHVVYRGGKWRMYAGAAGSSVFTLTDDDVVGKMVFRTETPANEKYNYVRGQFVDTERNWQLSEFEPRSNSAYETTDGDRKPREVSFPACTNKYEAQRNAIIVLKRSRLKRQVTLELGMSAFRIRPWDVGTLTLAEMGWTAQSVRCLSWSFDPSGTIEATFIEEDSTCWNDPAVGDYGVQTAAGNPTPGTYTPAAPTALTLTGAADGIYLEWDGATSNPPGTRFNLYEYEQASPNAPTFANATKIRSLLSSNSLYLPKAATTTTYYWITAEYQGTESDNFPSGTGVSGSKLAAPTTFYVTVYPSSASYVGTAASGTTNSVTVTPHNNAGSVTYSWSRTSGDSSTTATASTSATTAFTRSSMAVWSDYNSYWRCTATDTGSPTAVTTVDVSAMLYREGTGNPP